MNSHTLATQKVGAFARHPASAGAAQGTATALSHSIIIPLSRSAKDLNASAAVVPNGNHGNNSAFGRRLP